MNQESDQLQQPNPVWDWKSDKADTSHHELGKSRIRAAISILILSVIASVLYFKYHHVVTACVPAGIAAFLLLCIAFCPRCLKGIEKGLGHFASAVGTAITWILLVPFFYIVFGVLRFILLITRQDPMFRNYDSSVTSYWTDRHRTADRANLERQF